VPGNLIEFGQPAGRFCQNSPQLVSERGSG
jgi:hypothetical protein